MDFYALLECSNDPEDSGIKLGKESDQKCFTLRETEHSSSLQITNDTISIHIGTICIDCTDTKQSCCEDFRFFYKISHVKEMIYLDGSNPSKIISNDVKNGDKIYLTTYFGHTSHKNDEISSFHIHHIRNDTEIISNFMFLNIHNGYYSHMIDVNSNDQTFKDKIAL